jgi:hypothetical protein
MRRCSPVQPTRTHAAASAMRRVLAGMAVATLIPASMSISAESSHMFENGDQLYELCAAPKDTFSQGVCYGYIVGIADAMGGGASVHGLPACIPPSVTVGQTVNIVKQFLTSHPEMRHRGAGEIVAQAFVDAFPCR